MNGYANGDKDKKSDVLVHAGGLVGYNDGSIDGASSTATVFSTGKNVGGLVGSNNGGAKVTNSNATGSVTGNGAVGGLAGENDGTITGSSSDTGTISGVYTVGGLVGYNTNTIERSWSKSKVTGGALLGGLVGHNKGTIQGGSWAAGSATGTGTGTDTRVGGLVGLNEKDISDATASGAVTGVGSVGGLVGYNAGTIKGSSSSGSASGANNVGGSVGTNSNGTLDGVFATGVVKSDLNNAGGLIGWNEGTGSLIQNSYATGSVTASVKGGDDANGAAGGLIGRLVTGTVRYSYATGSVSGNDWVGGLVGKSDTDGTPNVDPGRCLASTRRVTSRPSTAVSAASSAISLAET